jgi:hypothetical protein
LTIPLSYNELANALVENIQLLLTGEPRLPKSTLIAYANGDAWSVNKIIETLSYKPWREIVFDDLYKCGFDEFSSYLTDEALVYYLPAFMVNVLKLTDPSSSRLREVGFKFMLPTSAGSEDVWDYFGDGLFDRPLNSSAEKMLTRINFVHKTLNSDQRECVAQYIELVESYGVKNPDTEFFRLLSKYSNFWRAATV